MARSIADYLAVGLIGDLDRDGEDFFSGKARDFSGDLDQLKAHAEDRCGFPISQQTLNQAIRVLADCGLIRITDDAYSGTFVKVKATKFGDFMQKAAEEVAQVAKEYGDSLDILTRPSDYPNAAALLKHELFEDYHELDGKWLSRALEGVRAKIEAGDLDERSPASLSQDIADTVPAADRVVTLQDNQKAELEDASTALIDAVEKENAIDGDTSLRQQILGQIKAGRELIRAQVLSVHLIYSTLMMALDALVKKYQNQALGYAAKKLLDLLIEHIFGK